MTNYVSIASQMLVILVAILVSVHWKKPKMFKLGKGIYTMNASMKFENNRETND